MAQPQTDGMSAALIVQISSAQKRLAETLTSMADLLVELAEASAEAHKAIDELAKTKPAPGWTVDDVQAAFGLDPKHAENVHGILHGTVDPQMYAER